MGNAFRNHPALRDSTETVKATAATTATEAITNAVVDRFDLIVVFVRELRYLRILRARLSMRGIGNSFVLSLILDGNG